MNEPNFIFSPYGRWAVLISCSDEISEALLERLLVIKRMIKKEKQQVITEIILTYNSLLVKYKNPFTNIDKEIEDLKYLILSDRPPGKLKSVLFHIPVCYDRKFGIDTEMLASSNNLDFQSVQKLHADALYLVYFIGFLPGFPYLEGLSEKLFCPRRDKPRHRITPGSVGIGGHHTGIYPIASPGGWQIIGHCPIRIFDAHKNMPCLFNPGDRIKFYPVSLKEHSEIVKAVETSSFRLKNERYESS